MGLEACRRPRAVPAAELFVLAPALGFRRLGKLNIKYST
jgi:hypothetical protein